jgi:hypothetical protein
MVGFVIFLLIVALLFGLIYRFIGLIQSNHSPYVYRFFGNIGRASKAPPIPSPEAEAYSRRLLEERRASKEIDHV